MTIKRANRTPLQVLERQPEPTTQPQQINIEELTAQITAQVTAQLAEQKQNNPSPVQNIINKAITYLSENSNTSLLGVSSGGTIAYLGYKSNDTDMIQTGLGIIASGTVFPDASTIGKALKALKK